MHVCTMMKSGNLKIFYFIQSILLNSKVGKQNVYLELCPSVNLFVFACSKQIKVSILFLPMNLGVPAVAVILYCGRPKINRSLLGAASIASAPVSLFPSAAATLAYNNAIIRSITIAITSGHQGISVTPSQHFPLFLFHPFISMARSCIKHDSIKLICTRECNQHSGMCCNLSLPLSSHY